MELVGRGSNRAVLSMNSSFKLIRPNGAAARPSRGWGVQSGSALLIHAGRIWIEVRIRQEFAHVLEPRPTRGRRTVSLGPHHPADPSQENSCYLVQLF